MMRWDIINYLIEKNNYKSYLEIGYFKGWSFDRVKCENKIAVDPYPCKTVEQEQFPSDVGIVDEQGIIWKQTSDVFFKNEADQKWDIIFIDGLHEASQVSRDLYNSINHLAEGGTIVMHDCNPPKYEHTTTGIDGCWTGDTYKAFLEFKRSNKNVIYCVDTDWGVGIIESNILEKGHGYVSPQVEFNWGVFNKDRKFLLGLITVEEFLCRN